MEVYAQHANDPALHHALLRCAPNDPTDKRIARVLFFDPPTPTRGTWSCLAEVMGVPVKTLMGVIGRRTPGSYGVAIRAARAGGIPVEQILSGRPVEAGACAVCGRKGAP